MKYYYYSCAILAKLTIIAYTNMAIGLAFGLGDGENAILKFEESNSQEDLELDCLIQMICKDFEKLPYNYLVNYGGNNSEVYYMANKLLNSIEGIPVHVGFFSEIAFLYNLHTRFIFTDTADTFSYLVEQMRVKAINSNRVRYMIVLLPGKENEMFITDIMSGIFGVMYDMYMLNVNIALATENGGYQFYTYYPYTLNDCDSTRPVLIHEYERGMEIPDLTRLFVHTEINMNLCPIKVSTAHLPPFMILDFEKSNQDMLSGVEGQVVRLIARKMNFTLDVQTVMLSIRGMVYENRTVTGVYKLLKERSTNMTVGECQCSPSVMRQTTATRTYYQSNIHILVKAGNPYSSFEVLFYPFQKYVWMLFVLSCALRYALISFLWKFVRTLPIPFRRFMLAMWLILIFYHRSLYEGFCFTYLRDRMRKPLPKSIDEFYAQDYIILSDLSTKNYVSLLEVDAKRILEYTTEPGETFKLLKQLNGKYGALVKREYFDYYTRNEALEHNDLFLIPDTLVVSMLCMYFPRFSHLVEFVDSTIMSLRSFGFIEKFASDYVQRHRVIYTTNRAHSQRRSKDHWTALTLTQLYGVFLLLAVFWALAAIIFCAEVLSTKFDLLRRLLVHF